MIGKITATISVVVVLCSASATADTLGAGFGGSQYSVPNLEWQRDAAVSKVVQVHSDLVRSEVWANPAAIAAHFASAGVNYYSEVGAAVSQWQGFRGAGELFSTDINIAFRRAPAAIYNDKSLPRILVLQPDSAAIATSYAIGGVGYYSWADAAVKQWQDSVEINNALRDITTAISNDKSLPGLGLVKCCIAQLDSSSVREQLDILEVPKIEIDWMEYADSDDSDRIKLFVIQGGTD